MAQERLPQCFGLAGQQSGPNAATVVRKAPVTFPASQGRKRPAQGWGAAALLPPPAPSQPQQLLGCRRMKSDKREVTSSLGQERSWRQAQSGAGGRGERAPAPAGLNSDADLRGDHARERIPEHSWQCSGSSVLSMAPLGPARGSAH